MKPNKELYKIQHRFQCVDCSAAKGATTSISHSASFIKSKVKTRDVAQW